jgi:hypothetical protein
MTRPISPQESSIIDLLLEGPFLGRDEIRLQLAHARVTPIEEHGDNYGSLEFEVQPGPKALVRERVPVDARALDEDGVPIDYLLHVVDGVVKELEVVKADGSPIRRYPKASDLTVSVRRSA